MAWAEAITEEKGEREERHNALKSILIAYVY